ncbi:chloramphenicol phosphotransferase CPT [Streptomyces sp. NPDC050161]|uniref:chloramphenicol phosphotransferase CPT n=1 Tax=Streptomyces sp. NPDC050161 TaxID=3365604 RepID=UPI00378FCEDB
MTFDVIVLNGGSSSGTSSLARALQDALLPRPWLTFGVDTLVEALPPTLMNTPAGLVLAPDGTVSPGPAFRALQDDWMRGIAAMARAGTGIILDEVFVGGRDSQQRWLAALDGLAVLWVGVRCAPAVATAREAARGDRIAGMAASQADLVHHGVHYDMEVDTGHRSAADCAREVAGRVG